ncbi:MOP flippase family protein [Siphonobacter curvatus]|uniref:Colanic acid exporter n=1 Tax=Siphonobacter curvatus TaxID=2094562 RepID=A0A2S7IE73_9BACT|nr:MOP flippase family protein [Siphonobacter curvatus]PQA52730.1 colanic acid exporter [Siphonobacter curvatus]
MSIKKQVITGVKWTTFSTVIMAVTQILRISILTRYLDKSDFGLIAIVTFVMSFMDLFNDMGLTSAILYKKDISAKEYASLYWLNLLVSILMYILVLIISPFISEFYNQPLLKVLVPLLSLNLIISAIGRQFKTIENKNLLFKNVSIVELSGVIVAFIIAVIMAVRGYGVYSLVYPTIIQYLVVNLTFLLIGLKKYGLLIHFELKETKPFLRIGGYQVGGQIFNYLNRDLDILLIGNLFSAEVLGGYSLAKQLVFRPAQIINPILTKVASPALAKFQDNIELLKINYLKLINIVSNVNILVYVGIMVFSPLLVKIMYGNGFEDIVVLVRILSVYMILRAIGNPVGSLVAATGRTDLEFYWNFITLFIMPLFIYVGSKLGIVEVTISLDIAMIILFVPNWKLLINKLTGATLQEYLRAIFTVNMTMIKSLVNYLIKIPART